MKNGLFGLRRRTLADLLEKTAAELRKEKERKEYLAGLLQMEYAKADKEAEIVKEFRPEVTL